MTQKKSIPVTLQIGNREYKWDSITQCAIELGMSEYRIRKWIASENPNDPFHRNMKQKK